MKCIKCRVRIVRHLWIVDGRVYCSPKCERGCTKNNHPKFCDHTVEKYGVAGLKKKRSGRSDGRPQR